MKARKFPPIRIGGYKYMPEEIFDVVNERDEVIDRQPRSEVHRLGLKHRAVHVLVFNSRGETFLQKRSMTKDREPGKWDSSTSGHVDSGEDYDACAVRELREEIGLAVKAGAVATRASPPLQKLFKIAACPETDAEFVWVYRCQAEGPFRLHPDEIETRWLVCAGKDVKLDGRKAGGFRERVRFIWEKNESQRHAVKIFISDLTHHLTLHPPQYCYGGRAAICPVRGGEGGVSAA